MKKLTALLASATMALSLVGCSAGKTYTGEAYGHDKENPVKVTLTIKDKTITKVEVDASHETNGIGSKAAETMPGAIVAANSLDVDGVSDVITAPGTQAYTSNFYIVKLTKKSEKSANWEDYKEKLRFCKGRSAMLRL